MAITHLRGIDVPFYKTIGYDVSLLSNHNTCDALLISPVVQ